MAELRGLEKAPPLVSFMGPEKLILSKLCAQGEQWQPAAASRPQKPPTADAPHAVNTPGESKHR